MELANAACSTSWSRPTSRWDSHAPLGTRMKRAGSWDGYGTCGLNHKVEINYSKLKELCLHNVPVKRESNANGGGHGRFMAEYSSIISPRKKSLLGESEGRKHSCNDRDSKPHSFNISTALINIHGRDKKQQDIIDLNSRLKAMLTIIKKQPVQRSSTEVKELAEHFVHFPALLPRMEMEVLVGVASRAKMEVVPRNTIGHSLPNKGGIYIILQGSVEKLSVQPTTNEIISEMLEAGRFFGELAPNEPHKPIKNCYPLYSTKCSCTLIRLTYFNYDRVLQTWESSSFSEKRDLIMKSPLLNSVSPSVITKLAEAIVWETIDADKTLLSEGEEITRVGFIQRGTCEAYVKVPRAPLQTHVIVGPLRAGDCIGEVTLRGDSRQPYTIVSVTRLRVGWVNSTVLRVNEVEKHILSDKAFALKTLSVEEIRRRYANMLMDKQWNKIKKDIVDGVMTERGIKRGHSKWKHSRSHSANSTSTHHTLFS